MTLSQQLNYKQTQGLVLTPQLQQAIKILELSNLELSTYLANEIMENPLLSVSEDDRTPEDLPVSEESADEEQVAFDSLWGEPSRGEKSSSSEGKDFILDSIETRPLSLREHLTAQLATDIEDPIEKLIGAFFISIVEETGYLPLDYQAQASILKSSSTKLDHVLVRLQQFDPSGIFSRSLSECLKLQLQDRGLLNDTIRKVLDNLDLIEMGEIKKLENLCKINNQELREILALIRQCDPKPGLKFSQSESGAIIPDIIVTKTEQGDWGAKLNRHTLPKVKVDKNYYDKLKTGSCQKAYVNERYSAANGMLKALQQRANSILAVSEYILSHQKEFFEQGIHHLKPMILQDVAQAIEMHESTISRVTTNKFMQTPRGTFELKFFFTSSIHSLHTQDQMSSRAVRERIREMILKEEKNKPLSDDQIMALMNAEGILVARRTVAKYRESLNIPSSFQRKRNYARQLEL